MIKDWMGYLEDGKVRVIEVEPGTAREHKALANELGCEIICWIAFKHESDALSYAEELYYG